MFSVLGMRPMNLSPLGQKAPRNNQELQG